MAAPFQHEAYALERDGGRFEYALVEGVFELSELDGSKPHTLRGTYESAAEELLSVWLFTRGNVDLALSFSGRRIAEWRLPTSIGQPDGDTPRAKLVSLKDVAMEREHDRTVSLTVRMAGKYVGALSSFVLASRWTAVDLLDVVRWYRASSVEHQDFLRWTSVFAKAARVVDTYTRPDGPSARVEPW